MEEIKELLAGAMQNGAAIEESIKASFHAAAGQKDANFLIIQHDKTGEIIAFKSGAEGNAEQEPDAMEYIKLFLPNVEMLLLLNGIEGEEEKEFFEMSVNVLKASFENSKYQTICYARHKKQFFGTGEHCPGDWEPLEIAKFIDLNKFIEQVTNIL